MTAPRRLAQIRCKDVVDHLQWRRRRALHVLRIWSLASDFLTLRIVNDLFVHGRSWPGRATLRLRPLGGRACEIRTDCSDAGVVYDTFIRRFHRPLVPLGDAKLILDLGANIGSTAADFAARFPSARIIAVEPEHQTAEICRRNLAPWSERVEVVEAAVWKRTGSVTLAVPESDPCAASIAEEGGTRVRAVTIDDLLASHEGDVDYMKVDVEGAEREIINAPCDWLSRVKVMHIEVHHGYTVEQCAADLTGRGFLATRDPRHPHAVTATRA